MTREVKGKLEKTKTIRLKGDGLKDDSTLTGRVGVNVL
jgi:hypothetical protein